MTKRDLKEKTRQETKNRHRIDEKNFAIESFDVVSFHETKAKKTEKERKREKEGTKIKHKKKDKKEERKRDTLKNKQKMPFLGWGETVFCHSEAKKGNKKQPPPPKQKTKQTNKKNKPKK